MYNVGIFIEAINATTALFDNITVNTSTGSSYGSYYSGLIKIVYNITTSLTV